SGSSFVGGTADHTLGQEWQYKSGISLQGFNSGISSSGLSNIFGPSGNFAAGGDMLDGAAYGIVGSLGNTNGGFKVPQVQNSVVFTLTTPAGFSLSSITSVGFQYGTSSSETFVPGNPDPVPVPSSLVLLGTFLVPAIGFYWFTNRKAALA